MIEKRRQKRLDVNGGAFASLSFRFTVLGKILNVSEGGLAFSYVASKRRSDESPFLDILLTDGSFRSQRIPFRTVWDKPMFDEFFSGDVALRHCGVEFVDLSESQQSDLRCFITVYASAE